MDFSLKVRSQIKLFFLHSIFVHLKSTYKAAFEPILSLLWICGFDVFCLLFFLSVHRVFAVVDTTGILFSLLSQRYIIMLHQSLKFFRGLEGLYFPHGTPPVLCELPGKSLWFFALIAIQGSFPKSLLLFPSFLCGHLLD